MFQSVRAEDLSKYCRYSLTTAKLEGDIVDTIAEIGESEGQVVKISSVR